MQGSIEEQGSNKQEERQRGSSWQTYYKKDPTQPPIQKSCSWHRVEPSESKSISTTVQNNSVIDIVNPQEKHGILLRIVGAVRNGSYMEYILEVMTQLTRWLVYRRYSNFYCLNERLKKLGIAHPTKHYLPPKGIKGNNSDGLVRKRTIALGKYLDTLVTTDEAFFLKHSVGKAFLDPKIPSIFYNKHLKTL